MSDTEKTWSFEDAQARFGELLDTCLIFGPQTISRGGVPQAVLAPLPQSQSTTTKQPSILELLFANIRRFPVD